MQQFVPLTDALLYAMDGLPGRLVPYRVGMACASVELAAVTTDQCETVSLSPVFAPIFSAVPALSSSTYCAGAAEG